MNEYYIENTGCQTLGYYLFDSYPYPEGNRIYYGNRSLNNLNAENLNFLLKEKMVSFPIKCEIIDDYNLKVVDDRIPKEFLIDREKVEYSAFKIYRDENTHDSFVLTRKVKEVIHEGFVYTPYILNIKPLNK